MLLVTGANGYVGRSLCSALVRQGKAVRYLGRSAPITPHLEWIRFDLADPIAPEQEVFDNVTEVIHCAGLSHRQASKDEYDAVNVSASLRLAKSAARAGVEHFIYLSSLNVVAPSIDDPELPAYLLSEPEEAYARSKWRAERVLAEACADQGMELTIVRAALIYDVELTANLAVFARIMRWWPMLFPRVGRRCLIGRPDVTRLLVACSDHTAGVKVGQPVVVATDGHCYDALTISQAFAGRYRLGTGRGCVTPTWLCRIGGRILDWRAGKPAGTSWGAMSAAHWCGVTPHVTGWQPELVLKESAQNRAAQ